MARLSLFQNDRSKLIPSVVADIFPLSEIEEGRLFVFEVLENEQTLSGLIGVARYYGIDGVRPFWAKLLSLEPCESTHPGLALCDSPTLRGEMEILGKETEH